MLPKSFTTVSQFSRYLALSILIIFPIFGFFLGRIYQNYIDDKIYVVPKNITNQVDKTVNEELQLCLDNRAKYSNILKSPYSFSKFGLSSSLFTGLTFSEITYTYKKSVIVSKFISPDTTGSSPWSVTVWSLKTPSSYLGFINGFQKYGSQFDFPIFDGYENHGPSPIFISSRMADWDQSKEKFVNSNNIEMHWGLDYAPKTIGSSIKLEFYIPDYLASHQAFVVIDYSVSNYPLVSGPNDPSVIIAKKKLKKIANTINLTEK